MKQQNYLLQTKEDLIKVAKNNYKELTEINKNRPDYIHKEVPALESLELETLEDDWSYTYKPDLRDPKNQKLKIIKERIASDKKGNFASIDKTVVEIVELNDIKSQESITT